MKFEIYGLIPRVPSTVHFISSNNTLANVSIGHGDRITKSFSLRNCLTPSNE